MPLIADNPVLKIPLGKATVYLSLVAGSQAIGISIPVRTFDAIGAKVGTGALIPNFNKNGILGAAGIYTSKTKGLNGFVLVADISSRMGNIAIPQGNKIQMQQAPLNYSEIKPSRRVEKKINRELYKLNRKRAVLRLR